MNKKTIESLQNAAIKTLTVQADSLEMLKKLKAKKVQLSAIKEDCDNLQKALLEGLNLAKGDNADIYNGNKQLVATYKTSHKKAFTVPEMDVSRLTIKTA